MHFNIPSSPARPSKGIPHQNSTCFFSFHLLNVTSLSELQTSNIILCYVFVKTTLRKILGLTKGKEESEPLQDFGLDVRGSLPDKGIATLAILPYSIISVTG